MANHPDQLVRNLVASATDEGCFDSGIISFHFYKNGEWVPVSVDTRIPYGDKDSPSFNSPIYGHCRNPDAMWVPLIEKAYARLHSNYVRVWLTARDTRRQPQLRLTPPPPHCAATTEQWQRR